VAGVLTAIATAIQAMKQTSGAGLKTAEATILGAAGTLGAPSAKAAEETAKATATAIVASMIAGAAGGADIHACLTPSPIPPHGPGVAIDGSQIVLIDHAAACRQDGRINEAVGPPDKNVMSEPTVLIGDAVSTAIEMIKASDFGKSPEGHKVLAELKALDAAGKIHFLSVLSNASNRGEWDGAAGITVHSNYSSDPNIVASELVHEATHAVYEDEFPASQSKLTIDEEVRTNINQLDFYEEQRKSGFRDPDLEIRRADRAAGNLRTNVRNRYPGVPEHL